MRQYELTAIFPLEEDQYKAGRAQVENDLGAAGAEILRADEKGDRDLAYEIKKRKRGRYVLFSVKTGQEKIAALDKAFRLNGNLLKYLFVRLEGRKGVKHG